MRCLLLYYSLTGQAQRAAELAAASCRDAGWEAVICRIDFADPTVRPKRPFKMSQTSFWTKAATIGTTMEICYDPADAIDGDYDLVLLFSNTWNQHPSVPVHSFLQSGTARMVLSGRPFAVYVVCRRLWRKNAELVRESGERAGGRFIGSEHFGHWGGQIGSLIQTVTYLHRSDTGMKHFLGIPVPGYGLSQESTDKVPRFTRAMLATIADATA